MKKKFKKGGKRLILQTLKVLKSVPFLGKVLVKLKSLLVSGAPEVYNYNLFYPTISQYLAEVNESSSLRKKPLISIVMPTYNTNESHLKECIQSVIMQSYANWELCIADDNSSDAGVRTIIEEFAAKDKRIRYLFREKNGHISEATNSALSIAGGDYVSLLDHDDVLWPNALFEVVTAINNNENAILLYSDEDKVDNDGIIHSYPFFKPDWSPEFLESCNYITHFTTIRKDIIDEVGGFRKGYEGAQDWDLFMRVTQLKGEVVHIPKVLYSWRVHDQSTSQDTDAKPYVYEAQKNLLKDYVSSTGVNATVRKGLIPQHAYIEHTDENLVRHSVVFLVGSGNDVKKWVKCLNGSHANIIVVQNKNHIAEHVEGNDKIEAFVVVDCASLLPPKDSRWLSQLLTESVRSGVGLVGGRLITLDGDRIFSAAYTIRNGYLVALLSGQAAKDDHYMRGLYGKSRRNVLLPNYQLFAISADNFNQFKQEVLSSEWQQLAVVATEMLEKGMRNIYNPMITTRVRTNDVAADYKMSGAVALSISDPYVNPNFDSSSSGFEVRNNA